MWEYTAFSCAIFWHSLSAFCYCNHWIWFTEDRSGFSLSGQTELICNCSVSIVFKSQIIPVYWTRSPLFSIWTFSLIVWLQLLCILILAIFFHSILIFISVLPLLCSCFISLDRLFGGYRFWLILFPLPSPCAIRFSSNSAYLYIHPAFKCLFALSSPQNRVESIDIYFLSHRRQDRNFRLRCDFP